MNPHIPGPSHARVSACSSGQCTSGAGKSEGLPEHIRQKIEDHPCFSEEAHHHFARMHVAVAPGCNIQCNYCNRKFDCANESRPGVVSEVLKPEDAVRKVLAVGAAIPQLSVVGIAGPGDPLANPSRTFATFRQLSEKAPDLKLCLSTNGLRLPEFADEIASHNIDHVTITINCLDPAIGAQIYPWIVWQGHRIEGIEAARILIAQQLKGLAMLVERGVLVKVNSVLIPGINDRHLPEVARHIRQAGVFLHNIMPLISAPEHGTHFGLSGQRGPTPEELRAVQDECAAGMAMMRHCRQCRADAVGLLGEDRSAEFSLAALSGSSIDHEAAVARRREVKSTLLAALQSRREVAAARPLQFMPRPVIETERPVLMAVAAKNGLVGEHFGHAREFLVYEASRSGVRLIGTRKTDRYCSGETQCGDGESALERTIRVLAGCEVVLCARIGFEPWSHLEAAGIQPNAEHALEEIGSAVAAVYDEMRRAGLLGKPALGRRVA